MRAPIPASARRAATCCGSTARSRVFLTVAGATGGAPGDDVLDEPAASRSPARAIRRSASTPAAYRAALLQPAARDRGRSALSSFADVQAAVLGRAARGVRLRCARSRPVGDGGRGHGADPHACRAWSRSTSTSCCPTPTTRRRPIRRSTPCPRSVRATTPRRGGRLPAELLLINPAGVTLTEMAP